MTSRTLEGDASSEMPTNPSGEEAKLLAQMTLTGHEELVTGVAMIPDSRFLVTCSQDKSLRLWNLDNGWQVGEPLLGHDSPVWSVTASSNGRWIASGAENGSILLWKVDKGLERMPVSFNGHWSRPSPISDVAFAPDTKTFASASYDNTVRVWLRETGETVRVLKLVPPPPSTLLYSVSYSPDGSKLVAGYIYHMQQLVVWNSASGEGMLKIKSCCRTAFTPDGLCLVSADGSGIRISDAATGDLIKRLDTYDNPMPLLPAVAPSGTKFAITSDEKSVQFFDLTALKPIGKPLEHPMGVSCMAILLDGQLIATGCRDNLVRIWTAPESKSEKESQKSAYKRIGSSMLAKQSIPSRTERAALPRGFFGDIESSLYPPRAHVRQSHFHIGSIIHRSRFHSALSPTIDIPLAHGKERNAAAGAPPKGSDGYVRDEDCNSPSSPNQNVQPLAPVHTNIGEHGSGRLCFCL